MKLGFEYVTYLESTPQEVWEALTDPEITARYWGHRNVSDWRVGSPWAHRRVDSDVDDVVGEVLESDPPHRLVTTWRGPADVLEWSTVTFLVQAYRGIVRLTVTHENLADEAERAAAASGWSAVLSNLKTLLETGRTLSGIPWEMPE